MEYCPALSPHSASSRLPRSALSVSKDRAACSIESRRGRLLFKALKRWDELSGGKRLGASVPVTLYHARASVGTADVSRQATCASYQAWHTPCSDSRQGSALLIPPPRPAQQPRRRLTGAQQPDISQTAALPEWTNVRENAGLITAKIGSRHWSATGPSPARSTPFSGWTGSLRFVRQSVGC